MFKSVGLLLLPSSDDNHLKSNKSNNNNGKKIKNLIKVNKKKLKKNDIKEFADKSEQCNESDIQQNW